MMDSNPTWPSPQALTEGLDVTVPNPVRDIRGTAGSRQSGLLLGVLAGEGRGQLHPQPACPDYNKWPRQLQSKASACTQLSIHLPHRPPPPCVHTWAWAWAEG